MLYPSTITSRTISKSDLAFRFTVRIMNAQCGYTESQVFIAKILAMRIPAVSFYDPINDDFSLDSRLRISRLPQILKLFVFLDDESSSLVPVFLLLLLLSADISTFLQYVNCQTIAAVCYLSNSQSKIM